MTASRELSKRLRDFSSLARNAASVRLRAVMSCMIFEKPMIVPALLRSGEMVRDTSMGRLGDSHSLEMLNVLAALQPRHDFRFLRMAFGWDDAG